MTQEQFEALIGYIDVIAAKRAGDAHHIGFAPFVQPCVVEDAKEKMRAAFFGSDWPLIEAPEG